jgi:hypothetical protein
MEVRQLGRWDSIVGGWQRETVEAVECDYGLYREDNDLEPFKQRR